MIEDSITVLSLPEVLNTEPPALKDSENLMTPCCGNWDGIRIREIDGWISESCLQDFILVSRSPVRTACSYSLQKRKLVLITDWSTNGSDGLLWLRIFDATTQYRAMEVVITRTREADAQTSIST
jgi:hypothetical protein